VTVTADASIKTITFSNGSPSTAVFVGQFPA
jgi:hypothetical protein